MTTFELLHPSNQQQNSGMTAAAKLIGAALKFVALVLAVIGLASAALCRAQQTCQPPSLIEMAATVTTDHSDYTPGATANITGVGFLAGETVQLLVLHLPNSDDNNSSPAHQPWTVIAAQDGSIASSWLVPNDQDELGATLQLTATGLASGSVANSIFTDSTGPNPVVAYVYINNNLPQNSVSAFAQLASGDLQTISGSPFLTAGTSATFCFNMDSIAVCRPQRRVYASNQGNNTVSGFDIQADGSLVPIPGSPFSTPANPVGVASDPAGRFLYVACHDDGVLAVYAINASGQLSPVTGSPFPTAMGCWTVELHPAGNFVYAVCRDPGDAIFGFAVSPSGSLTPVPGSPVCCPANSHGSDVSPDGSFLFVQDFNGSSNIVYAIQPDGSLVNVPNTASWKTYVGLAINPSGTTLYNGGSLSVYGASVSPSGNLSLLPGSPFPAGGWELGGLVVSPDGKRLFAAGSSGPQLGVFDIDSSGALTIHPGSPYDRGASGCACGMAVIPASQPPTPAAIPDQSGTYGSPFSYTFPVNTFTPSDPGQTLTYTASGMPPGIGFASSTRTFSGTPTSVGLFNVTVTATDNSTPPLIASAAFNFMVAQAPLTIAADNQSKSYGAALPALTVSYSGFVNGDSPSSLTTQPVVTTTATGGSPVGTYPITASAAVDPNYTISYLSGTMMINPAPLTITADNKTMILGGALPDLTASYSGFVNGDTPDSLATPVNLAVAATSASPAGNYAIIPSGATSPNYDITFVEGALSIQYEPLGVSCGGNPGHVILPPITPDGSSIFKQGSTVPAKFRVFDANCNSIGTPGVVQSFNLVKIVSGTTSDTVNEAVTSRTPDTAFRWDSTDQQWVFNISTGSLAASMTYYYVITLNDGTSIPFSFGLK